MTPRFESLQAPLDERRKLLEAAVDLYEFYHYHDMELNWINERLPIAHSMNCGKSLDVAQSLLQKHKVTPLIKCITACWHIAFHLSLQTSTCIVLLYLREDCCKQNVLPHFQWVQLLIPAKMVPVGWDKSAIWWWFSEQTWNSCGNCKICHILQYYYYYEKFCSSSH